ncbi:transcription antiterminator [Virgibacillus sp. NKC19-3]|uniref:BglG family transcription antiterminator n=1 Tax=Virgibacillus saliphilus TaxID=2831674 RepID=UPI001C9AEA41|nr:BglG family transcription antiterminator [Virgibacillus sp. NKC19-3]MBY7141743.1 transcription antiterminator [Virgibacillus sp. NKC19-3]
MVKALNAKHKKIIQFVLDKKLTTYDELAHLLNQSKRTIAKDIDEVNRVTQGIGVKVVAKQNKGVYLEGNTQELGNFLGDIKTYNLNLKEDRVIYVYSRFLSASHHLKVQELADELYVSRSTLEITLKEVRRKFSELGYHIENSKDGMKLQASEKERRYLMSSLINYYWGGLSRLDDKEEELMNQLKASPDLGNVLNTSILHKVISILNVFLSNSNLTCTDYEYKSLVIHLTIALDRIRKNKFLDSHRSKIHLFENTVILVELIEKDFAITIPQYEREYINNHIMAIEINVPNNKNRNDVSIGTNLNLNEILLNGLGYLDLDKELLRSLTLHLDAAIKRLQLGLSIHNPYTEKIKLSFPRAFDDAASLAPIIEKTYDIHLNDDEIAFIALHIEAFFERCPDIKRKKDVVLVCSSGLGTSKLLEQRIKDNFLNDLNVTRVLSVKDLEQANITEDSIISTIPLRNTDVPVVVVSPMLDTNDLNFIKKELHLKPLGNQKEAFLSCLEDDLLFVESGKDCKNKVLNYICDTLLQKGYAKEGIFESALNREEISSTAMGNFAMPHVKIDYISEPRISIYVNKDGINWDSELVNVVFFFALNKDVKPIINGIYEFFNHVISDENMLRGLALVNDGQEIVRLLEKV